MTAITTNAAGIAVNPVVAYAVGITPAATVNGATPARTKNNTAGTPSRSAARAFETALGLPAVRVRDISEAPSQEDGRSGAVGQHAESTAAWVQAIRPARPGARQPTT
jgi:hypothetical protein